MKIHMIKVLLVLVSLSGAAAWGLSTKTAYDHTHSDLPVNSKGIFNMGHSGGLDQNGGHYDRSNGTYHYHR